MKKTDQKQSQASLETLSQWRLIGKRFAKHHLAMISMYILILFYLLAIFAEFFAPYPMNFRQLSHANCPPQKVNFSFSKGLYVNAMRQKIDPVTLQKYYDQDPTDPIPIAFFAKGQPCKLWGLIPIQRHFLAIDQQKYHARVDADNPENVTAVPTFYLFGADRYGRDVYSRVIYGARISLSVGIISIIITFVLGLAIGGVSGYVGGRVDNVIQRTIEIINAFPQLPLWLAFAAAMPTEWSPLAVYFMITIVLSLFGWTGLARVTRGKILALREEDYATAAYLLGAGHSRIIFRHLLPGFTSHIIVTLTMTVPGMILGETALSFLGLGLRPPIVSWGVILQDCMNIDALASYPWLLLPVLFIIVTVLAYNFLGDGLRDAADPYSVL